MTGFLQKYREMDAERRSLLNLHLFLLLLVVLLGVSEIRAARAALDLAKMATENYYAHSECAEQAHEIDVQRLGESYQIPESLLKEIENAEY